MIEIEKLIKHPIQLINVEMIKCNINKNISEDISFNDINLKINLQASGKISERDSRTGYTFLEITIHNIIIKIINPTITFFPLFLIFFYIIS